MYKLSPLSLNGKQECVQRLSDFANIPFDPANSDYQQFKLDIQGLRKDFNGNSLPAVELQDSTGAPITGEALTTFVQGLK